MNSRWLVGALLLLPVTAQAERTLTLSDAFELTEQGNLDMVAARHHMEQAAPGIRQAMAALLPQVAFQGKYTHNYKEVDLYLPTIDLGPFVIQKEEQLDSSLNVTAPLINPQAYPGLDAARKANDLAKDVYALTKTQVMYGVAQAFYAAAGTDELLAARRHAIDVAQETLEIARTRLQSGNATRLDVSRAELALVEAQKAADEAVTTQAMAYRALATLLQLRDPFHVASGEIVPEVTPAPEKRPEIGILEKTLQIDDLQRVLATRKWYPTLSAFGMAHLGNYEGFTGNIYSWGLGLQLDWSIYDGGGRQAAEEIAVAQKLEAEAQLRQQRDTIDDELANAKQSVETRSRSVVAAQREVDLAHESLDLVRVRYEAGSATQLDVLQAQDQIVLTEVGLAQARFDLALANIALDRASGALLRHAELSH